jgi:hypothetical protein
VERPPILVLIESNESAIDKILGENKVIDDVMYYFLHKCPYVAARSSPVGWK